MQVTACVLFAEHVLKGSYRMKPVQALSQPSACLNSCLALFLMLQIGVGKESDIFEVTNEDGEASGCQNVLWCAAGCV